MERAEVQTMIAMALTAVADQLTTPVDSLVVKQDEPTEGLPVEAMNKTMANLLVTLAQILGVDYESTLGAGYIESFTLQMVSFTKDAVQAKKVLYEIRKNLDQ